MTNWPVMLAQALALVAGLGVVKVAAEALSVGEAATFFSLLLPLGFVRTVVMGPTSIVACRYAPSMTDPSRLMSLVQSVTASLLWLASGVLLVCVLLWTVDALFLGSSSMARNASALVAGVALGWHSAWIDIDNSLRNARRGAFSLGLLSSIQLLAFLPALTFNAHFMIFYFICTALAATIAGSTHRALILRQLRSGTANPGNPRLHDADCSKLSLRRLAAPVCLWLLMGYCISFADRWVVAALFDERSVASYLAVSALCTSGIAALLSIGNREAMPRIFEKSTSLTDERGHVLALLFLIRYAVSFLVIGAISVLALMTPIADPLLHLVLSPDVAPESQWLPALLLASSVSLATVSILSSEGLIRGHTLPHSILRVGGGVACVSLFSLAYWSATLTQIASARLLVIAIAAAASFGIVIRAWARSRARRHLTSPVSIGGREIDVRT